ncbi:O-methyltransferase MdmC-like [Ylistrum balloti]|uniref:O-methyltransferase MdmC-like n=1 Tax=Ylistrum balloti TaxID=509963 RepID=UPI002905E710|nr:O-methyltransferase MdmC-like [Ylistrum balloti]XP_060079851.1 O-methyltransferase MdmC-like [Ylistrum balloti]
MMASTPKRAHRDPVVRNLWALQELALKHDVPDEVKQQIDLCLEVVNARDDYCDMKSSSASEHVTSLIEQTQNHPWSDLHKAGTIPFLHSGMISGKLEGNFLKTIISLSNAKKVLELGLFTGCGALTIAEALPADGSVTSCEIAPYVKDLARKFMDKSPHGKKVTIKIGSALDSLAELADAGEKYDIIFIDADKDNYLNYYKIIMDKDMLTARGTILADNTLFQGAPYCHNLMSDRAIKLGQIIRDFNDFVEKDERVYQVLVPIRDGLTMIRRRSDVEGTS